MKMISGLDEDSFVACCRLVLQKSEELRDGWRWEQGSEGYLRKTVLHSVSIQEAENSEREIAHKECQSSEAVLLDDEDDDNVAGANCPADPPLWVHSEFHVLFSSSYRTPVMFFRSNTLEGRALSLDAMWSFIKPKLKSSSEEDLLSTVTQQEHPLLGQTFFMLHPCKTNTFMRPVLQAAQRENRAVNYVLTWLSVVGPLVGLEVPLEYCSGSRTDQT
ncbi:unnamed protein product [Knipowitschia caucasica]